MCVMLIHLSPSSASEEILRRCQISITGGPRWARVLRLEGPRPLLHHKRKGEGVEVRSQKRKRKNHPRNRRQGMPRRREVQSGADCWPETWRPLWWSWRSLPVCGFDQKCPWLFSNTPPPEPRLEDMQAFTNRRSFNRCCLCNGQISID